MNRRTRKLRRENKKARENLTYSNQFELDHIMAYFDGAPITDYQREEIHRDLIAMLSDGQARGVRTKDVVGEEPLDFCNAILAEIEPPPPSHNVFRFLRAFFLYTFVYSLSFFLMYQMIPWARGANEDKIYLTILNVANLFLMAFAIEAARRWNNKRVRTTHLWKAVLALLVIIALNIAVGIVQVAIGEFWIVVPEKIVAIFIVVAGILWRVFAELVD